ncbi:MAG: DsbA family protein [Salinarimonadaceae bacterium]|nr:MAG: DsbA family protein [Salinarimonadaceae bacterium]
MTHRRDVLTMMAGVGLAAFTLGLPASAQQAPAGETAPLTEMAIGDPDAPIEIIEYASLTCSHCGTFHNTTYPLLKERYVETGKVRFIIREFPLDPLALGAFMLARCEEDKYWPIIDMLFEKQREWAYVDRPLDALAQMMRQAGFSQEKFKGCLRDEAVHDGIIAVRAEGERRGVNSTPTFFIDGERYTGAMSIEEFERILAPKIGG